MKKVIVTGASSGVGYQTVKTLVIDQNCHVVAVARNAKLLQKLKDEILAVNQFAKIDIIPFDLAQENYVNLRVEIDEILGEELDALINNAGVLINKPFLDLSSRDFEQVYGLNVFAVSRLIQMLYPKLRKSKGHILNISSMGGFQGSAKFAGLSAYSSSKAALACLTECLAEEFKEDKVAVNALAFGAVQTEMLEKAFPGYDAPVNSAQMGVYVAGFVLTGNAVYNGKILPVSVSTP